MIFARNWTISYNFGSTETMSFSCFSLTTVRNSFQFNAATKAIRIYGSETERQEISQKLDNLVETLKLLRIDVPLIVRKTSLNVVGKNLAKYRNPGLRDELRLLYNRLYATGTEDGIEKLKYDLKDHIIQPRGDIDIGDCGLCFSPLENPTFLQVIRLP
jgi:hypothetical protein